MDIQKKTGNSLISPCLPNPEQLKYKPFEPCRATPASLGQHKLAKHVKKSFLNWLHGPNVIRPAFHRPCRWSCAGDGNAVQRKILTWAFVSVMKENAGRLLFGSYEMLRSAQTEMARVYGAVCAKEIKCPCSFPDQLQLQGGRCTRGYFYCVIGFMFSASFFFFLHSQELKMY